MRKKEKITLEFEDGEGNKATEAGGPALSRQAASLFYR